MDVVFDNFITFFLIFVATNSAWPLIEFVEAYTCSPQDESQLAYTEASQELETVCDVETWAKGKVCRFEACDVLTNRKAITDNTIPERQRK